MWTIIPMSNAQWETFQRDFEKLNVAASKHLKVIDMLLEENKKGNLPRGIWDKFYEIMKG